MIRFLLNDQPIELDDVAPHLSVLQYVRGCLGLTGTKEGCAAGDCGACTVALGELSDTGIEYHAVNACITPVGALHGRQLLTVEHLARGDTLHPVQNAMVECHGSQCGFCTPGVVMSLFSWWHAAKTGRSDSDRPSMEAALSGNLCRCTGYQPIFRAAQQSLAAGPAAGDPQVLTALASLQAEEGATTLGETRFFAPADSAELVRLLSQWPQAQLVAGATDLGLEFTQHLKTPQVLIATDRVRELLDIRVTPDALWLGGAVTYRRAQPFLAEHFPAFDGLLERLGSVQIRNRGTLGGNVANASPIGDTPPVLLALGAAVHLRGSAGARTLPLEQFFTGYRTTALRQGEFIEYLELPKLGAGDVLKVYKISKRFDDDISAVCLALWLRLDQGLVVDARLGCGGMAATPARAPRAEQALRGRPLAAAAIEAAKTALALDFTPLDDVRASAAYRLAVAGNLLTRALLEIQGGTPVALRGGSHA